MQRAGYIKVTFQFHREGSQWVGECLELGTSTYAATLEETERELMELVTLHLNTLANLGERERFFSENGIEIFYNDLPKTVNINSVNPDFYVKAHFHNLPVTVG